MGPPLQANEESKFEGKGRKGNSKGKGRDPIPLSFLLLILKMGKGILYHLSLFKSKGHADLVRHMVPGSRCP